MYFFYKEKEHLVKYSKNFEMHKISNRFQLNNKK